VFLSTGGPDVIPKDAWPFYRTVPGVRLCWELEQIERRKKVRHPCTDMAL